MNRTRNILAIAVLTVICLYSCSKNSGTGGTTGGGTGGTQAGPLFTAVKTVVQDNCALSGCHAGANPQSGINFNNDATIVAQSARIKVRAVDEVGTPNQMPQPPRQALSAADQKKITDWIGAGGKISD